MRVLETYTIEVEGLELTISIEGDEGIERRYVLSYVEFTKPTLALFNSVKTQLIAQVPISTQEMVDQEQIKILRERFRQEAENMLLAKIPTLKEDIKKILVTRLLYEMLGLGRIDYLLHDENLEEIIINACSEPVRVYHRKYGWVQTNIVPESEEQIKNYSDIIARRVGKDITTLNPILDAQLVSGDRVNAVLNPISTKGHTIIIRRFARDPWTMTDFLKNNTVSADLLALIWLALQYEMNFIISGGTGSGKTSMLNICMPFMPPNHRIITIEDTRELQLPGFLYWSPLATRQANAEGKGEITMLDLVINALRMRPDRIVMGEIRKKRDAEVLFEAMHTGHSVYATLHADSMQQTISRLTNPPIEVPPHLLESVNLNIVMFRDRKTGKRRMFQLGEFVVEDKGNNANVNPNVLYRWNPTDDTFISHSSSVKLFEDITRHTGLTQKEIENDLEQKRNVLNYLVQNNLRTLDDVGKVMKDYYADPQKVYDMALKGLKSPPKSKDKVGRRRLSEK